MDKDITASSSHRILRRYFESNIICTPLNKESVEPLHDHDDGNDNQADKDFIGNVSFSERDKRFKARLSTLDNAGDKVPERHTQRQDCCSWDVQANNDDPKEFSSPTNTTVESMARLERKVTGLETAFRSRGYDSNAAVRRAHEREVARVMLRSMHLVNLVAIRQRWQTLRLYRALDQWRKTRNDGWKSTNECTTGRVHTKRSGPEVDEQSTKRMDSATNNSDQECSPLHTRTRQTNKLKKCSVGRVQDVVAAVVAADAMCCSVVQEFVFPQTKTFEPSIDQPNPTTPASLLELLAASSEFDRPNIHPDLMVNGGEDEHRRFELESIENWRFAEEGALNQHELLSFSGELITSEGISRCSPFPASSHALKSSATRNPAHVALSLCVDSIDMARRALGPCIQKLCWRVECKDKVEHGTGIERELLRFLDKRLITMSERIKAVLIALRECSHPSPPWAPSGVSCDALETMFGEFCLQIVVRLCEQLPSAATGCVAGRLHLEAQLKQFSDRLTTELLPVVASDRHDYENPTARTENGFTTFFDVAIELLAVVERIKLVWYLADHAKRQRLLLTQALKAATFNTSRMAKTIATLETQNEILVAKLAKVEEELINMVERSSRIEYQYSQHQATIAELEKSLKEERSKHNSATKRMEEAESRCDAINEQFMSQVDQIAALERRVEDDTHKMIDLESRLTVIAQERDEGILLLSQTEEMLMSAQGREKELKLQLEKWSTRQSKNLSCLQAELDRTTLELDSLREELTHAESALESSRRRETELENQLNTNSNRELEEINHLREELHKATLEGASLREELAELLDHSTLQNAAMDTMKCEQIEAAKQLQEWNLEREGLELRCGTQRTLSEQREQERDHALLQVQHLSDLIINLEKQQETSRRECLTMHETLQHQANAFQNLQTLQEANSCSIIQDLERQIHSLRREICSLETHLKEKEAEAEYANDTAASRLEILMEEAQISETKLSKMKRGAYQLTQQLQTCRLDLSGSIQRWIRAETQCAILRISLKHSDNKRTEATTELEKCIENKKPSKEVVKLRAMVMKLRETIDAKDDILLFLDRKVAQLEKLDRSRER